jgi:hypothetical protein
MCKKDITEKIIKLFLNLFLCKATGNQFWAQREAKYG